MFLYIVNVPKMVDKYINYVEFPGRNQLFHHVVHLHYRIRSMHCNTVLSLWVGLICVMGGAHMHYGWGLCVMGGAHMHYGWGYMHYGWGSCIMGGAHMHYGWGSCVMGGAHALSKFMNT